MTFAQSLSSFDIFAINLRNLFKTIKMKISEALTKYPKLINVLKEAGIRSRADIIKIEVDHPTVTHNLHFIGDKKYQKRAIEFKVHVKGNILSVKTTDNFETSTYEWKGEIYL